MLDGTGRSSPNLTYTCVVGITPRLGYITWKDVLKRGEGKIKRFFGEQDCERLYNFIVHQDYNINPELLRGQIF